MASRSDATIQRLCLAYIEEHGAARVIDIKQNTQSKYSSVRNALERLVVTRRLNKTVEDRAAVYRRVAPAFRGWGGA